MDYEYYSVDTYYPIDPQREPDTAREVLALFSPAYEEAARAIENFFCPAMNVNIPGALFPIDAKTFGDSLMTRCRTSADLETTLLRH